MSGGSGERASLHRQRGMLMSNSPPTDRPQSRSWRRVWGARLLKFGCATLFGLVLLEIGLRIAGFSPAAANGEQRDPADLHPAAFIAEAQRQDWLPWPSTEMTFSPFREHPRGYVLMRRNRCGFREDVPTPVARPPETTRIIVTGDSHTDGVAFNEETCANRLEAALNSSRKPQRFDVVNAAIPRSSPYQQLWAYQQVLSRFEPDMLVVGFYAGNDLLDLMRTDDRVHLVRDGVGWSHSPPDRASDTTQARHSRWENFKNTLRTNLAIYEALSRIRWLRRTVRRTLNDPYRDRLDRAEKISAAATWQGFNQAYYFRHHPQKWAAAADMLRHVLTSFRNATSAANVSLVLLVIPTYRQIHPGGDQAALQSAAAVLELTGQDLLTDERACDTVVTLAGELGITAIDLREPMRRVVRESPQARFFYRFDHHLNLQGHRLAAKLLERAVVPVLDQRSK